MVSLTLACATIGYGWPLRDNVQRVVPTAAALGGAILCCHRPYGSGMVILMAVTIIYRCEFCLYPVHPSLLTLLLEQEIVMHESGGPEMAALGKLF